MTFITKYLDILKDILDKCHEEYHRVFGGIIIEIVLDDDNLTLLDAVRRYNKTRLTPALLELQNFPVLALRTEILKNYISFPREDQTKFYTKLLLDFAYNLGIHLGYISTYTEIIKEFFKEKDPELLIKLLVYQDDLYSIEYKIENINDAMKGVYPNDEDLEKNNEKDLQDPDSSLKWNCSPSIAGYIISELIRAGYIEPPTTHGELSYAKLAGICNQIFDIQSKGKRTTLDYLKKVVNPESNSLPDTKRVKLKLPDLDQLT